MAPLRHFKFLLIAGFPLALVAQESVKRVPAPQELLPVPASLAVYRQALQQKPLPSDVCLDAAAAFEDAGRLDDSVDILQACMDEAPKEKVLRPALGQALFLKGDLLNAKALLGEFDDPYSQLTLARIALEEGAPQETLSVLKALEEKRPAWALVPYYRGRAHEAAGQWEKALEAYQNVLRIDPHFAEVRPRMAALNEKLKRVDEAWRQYSRVLIADPREKAARERQAALAPHLTKKPEEIIPPSKISQHTAIRPAASGGPVLKIGIGSSGAGKAYTKKSVTFRTSADFILVDGATEKTLAKGRAGEEWTLQAASGSARIINSAGKAMGKFQGSVKIRMKEPEKQTVILNALTYASGSVWSGLADKELRGVVEAVFKPSKGSLKIINHVGLEEYLQGVVGAEMPSHWPMEALKSQAVIARTFALYLKQVLRLHRTDGYDLCDEQHCQVYGGVKVEKERAVEAAQATTGRALFYKDKPAHTVYSSNCGGHTQSGQDIGWGAVPYWEARTDKMGDVLPALSPGALRYWLMSESGGACAPSRYVEAAKNRWARVISAQELEKRVRRRKDIGRLTGVSVARRSESGHVTALKISGVNGELTLKKEHEIRRALGLGPLRSTLFWVEAAYREGNVHSFTVYGGGWGHAVGLCQSGASGRAEGGAFYTDILAHYFPGTHLMNLSDERLQKTK
jgi:SpoIID/LytB domain protein